MEGFDGPRRQNARHLRGQILPPSAPAKAIPDLPSPATIRGEAWVSVLVDKPRENQETERRSGAEARLTAGSTLDEVSQAPNTRSRRNHHRGREVVAWTTAGITFVGLMISLTNERRHEKLQYVEPILVQRSGMAPELILSATALLDDAALGRSS